MVNCEVKTKNGVVRGKQEDGIIKWLGIPYAKKPLGEYRFRKAQPVDNWEGILETTQYSKKPIQPPFLTANPEVEESEDCLYLNIWSSGTEGKKPVVFFIYGSAYIVGEASMETFDGTHFAQDDIVFVSFNYRVGVFGGYDFSHLAGGTKEFDDNIFVSDQIQALRWVYQNIEQFGGNKEDITVLGESAGGCSVFNLLASPATKGMIHKAIVESGVINSTVKPIVGNKSMKAFLEHLNIKEDELWKLKEMDAEDLSDASLWLFCNYTKLNPGIPLPGGITEGEYLKNMPLEELKKGCAKGIKLLIGTNMDETTLFIHGEDSNMCSNKEEVEAFLDNTHTPEELKKKIEEYYNHFQTEQNVKDFMKDYEFVYDSAVAAGIQSQFADTYMYQFAFNPEPCQKAGLGSFHSFEMPFVFDTVDTSEMKPMYDSPDKNSLIKVRNIMHHAWVNFIKYGNPNGMGEEIWPQYDLTKQQVLEINTECKVLTKPYEKLMKLLGQFKGYRD